MISHSRDSITFKQGFTQKQFLEVVFLTGACTFFRHSGCCLGRSALVMLMPWHGAEDALPVLQPVPHCPTNLLPPTTHAVGAIVKVNSNGVDVTVTPSAVNVSFL